MAVREEMRGGLYLWSGLVCAVLGSCVYLSSLDCQLVFDDAAAIEGNGDLRPNASWTNLLRNDFWGLPISDADSHKSYRPLCVATFRINYMFHELEPLGYHLVNVVLHGMVCFLFVQLCAMVFGHVWPSLVAGMLFAVHPIHTEAVCELLAIVVLLVTTPAVC